MVLDRDGLLAIAYGFLWGIFGRKDIYSFYFLQVRVFICEFLMRILQYHCHKRKTIL